MTDYANFCCPEYLNQMTDLIRRNWNQNQGATGQVQVKFTIRRDGTLTDVPEIEKRAAIRRSSTSSPSARSPRSGSFRRCPRAFTENTLTVHLIFEYQR